VKFLPDDPATPHPGQCAQGGPLGPFIRSKRTPVDVETSAQRQRRGYFGFGAKSFRYADAATRAGWVARVAAGLPGSSSAAGTNGAGSTAELGPISTAPLGTLVESLTINTAVFSLTSGFVVNVTSNASAADYVTLAAAAAMPVWNESARPFFTLLVLPYSAAMDLDGTAPYNERFGIPLEGYQVRYRVRFFLADDYSNFAGSGVGVTA